MFKFIAVAYLTTAAVLLSYPVPTYSAVKVDKPPCFPREALKKGLLKDKAFLSSAYLTKESNVLEIWERSDGSWVLLIVNSTTACVLASGPKNVTFGQAA